MRSVHHSLLTALLALLFTPANGQELSPTFTRLDDGVEVHTSYHLLSGKPFPSNGLIVQTRDSVVLIDTGWGIKATRKVLKHLKGRPVAACLVTHFHDDRTGGIPVLRKQGIRCMGTPRTRDLALASGESSPNLMLSDDTTFTIDGVRFVFFFPGPGHTADNMVVWLPDHRILFGGCLVKSTAATNLGNIMDADLVHWPDAIRNVQRRFPEAILVIPGHQTWGGPELLEHTLGLLQEH